VYGDVFKIIQIGKHTYPAETAYAGEQQKPDVFILPFQDRIERLHHRTVGL